MDLRTIESKIAEYDLASRAVYSGHWLSQYFAKQRDEQIKKWEDRMRRSYNGGVYGNQRK